MEKATFGAGCFWGVEASFRKLKGVHSTQVGYSGGSTENPTYEEVCTDKTGHAEVVEVEFDPNIISYNDLLDVFWKIHDPTQLNRQGPDTGTQYRSVIMVHSEKQKQQAEQSKQAQNNPDIVTEIIPVKTFYKAEEYHQQYFEKKGGH